MLRKSKVLKCGFSLFGPARSYEQGCLSSLQRNQHSHFHTINSPSKRYKSAHDNILNEHNNTVMFNHGVKTSTDKVELSVSPKGFLLVDDELRIVLRGLTEGQIVTVHAVLKEEKKVYESCCTFQADKNGVVNLATQSSKSGTYTGVSSMGIFWSMVPAPGQQEGSRLMKKDMESPFRTILYTYDGELSLEELHQTKKQPFNVSEIDRWYKGEGVSTQMVRDGNVRGKLYLPKGSGPFPGVIDLFGTVGGITEHRAALLASRGFAALALPYFGYEDLSKDLGQISLDYFLEAIDWLLGHKQIYPEKLGVIGTSKGGDFALLMGAFSPKVSAIVNVNGCTFPSSYPVNYSGGFIPAVDLQLEKVKVEGEAYIFKDAIEFEEKDLIPVWRNNAKVLNILSEDDMCSPKECIRLMKRCYPTDQTDNFTVLAYDKAGHLLEPPYTPLCRMSYHKAFNMYMMWGGYPEEHAEAQKHAWKNILEFLHKNIPQTMAEHSKMKSNL